MQKAFMKFFNKFFCIKSSHGFFVVTLTMHVCNLSLKGPAIFLGLQLVGNLKGGVVSGLNARVDIRILSLGIYLCAFFASLEPVVSASVLGLEVGCGIAVDADEICGCQM